MIKTDLIHKYKDREPLETINDFNRYLNITDEDILGYYTKIRKEKSFFNLFIYFFSSYLIYNNIPYFSTKNNIIFRKERNV